MFSKYNFDKILSFKEIIFWTIAVIFILANLFFSLISLIEIYQVGFTDIEKQYPWGAEPFPWYYDSKNTYLVFISSWTLVFIVILFFQIYYFIKDNKIKELIFALVFFLGIITLLIANGPMN